MGVQEDQQVVLKMELLMEPQPLQILFKVLLVVEETIYHQDTVLVVVVALAALELPVLIVLEEMEELDI